MRKIIFALALALLPAAAFAQEHQHAAPPKPAMDHKMEMKQHEDFVQSVLNKRAELKLSAAQVAKVKAFQAKMQQHHKSMMKGDMMMMHDSMKTMKHDSMKMKHDGMMPMKHDSMKMKHDGMMADDMHKEFLAIFTPAQRKQVEAMMKTHMAQCAKDGSMQCKMDSAGMPGMKHMEGMKPEKKDK